MLFQLVKDAVFPGDFLQMDLPFNDLFSTLGAKSRNKLRKYSLSPLLLVKP